MHLAHFARSASITVSMALLANGQNQEIGEPCGDDLDCRTGCCGSQVVPTPLCLDTITQAFGEECFTEDGCDCWFGLCDTGFCPEEPPTPTPTARDQVCNVDTDCQSGCCASRLDPSICVAKGIIPPGGDCFTADGCDCFIAGQCTDGICPGTPQPTPTPWEVDFPTPTPSIWVLPTPTPSGFGLPTPTPSIWVLPTPTPSGFGLPTPTPSIWVLPTPEPTPTPSMVESGPGPTTIPPGSLPPTAPPAPAVCADGTSLCDDPHMQGIRGQKIDWSGIDGSWYCMVTDDSANIHINVRLTAPLPDEFPDRQLITGLSVISEGHSLVLEVTNPYHTDTKGCPQCMSPCLAAGGLSALVDGGDAPNLLRFSRDEHVEDGIVVSASNLPVECRQFGGDRIWARMYDEMLQGRRKLTSEGTLEDWILSFGQMAAPDWCALYITRHELADVQSNHAVFKITTSSVTVRLNVGINYQGNGELDWDGRVLPDLEFWQMDVGLNGLSVESESLSGILGETSRPVLDEAGLPIMEGFEAFRGTVEDYRVSGPLGTDFDLQTSQ